MMEHELGEKIDQRVGGDNSTDPETAISVGATEIADSNPKTSESTQKQAAVEDEKGKLEGRDKSPSQSHVIDINCNNNLGENQRVCRICHLNAKEIGKSSIELMELGCGCKGELGVAHLHCAEAWFRVKGNRLCEICGEIAKNMTGVGDMEEWSESRSGDTNIGSSRRCLRGQPLCNFLMACLVISFVLPWFFRVNMF